jgi:hypothetical protein
MNSSIIASSTKTNVSKTYAPLPYGSATVGSLVTMRQINYQIDILINSES